MLGTMMGFAIRIVSRAFFEACGNLQCVQFCLSNETAAIIENQVIPINLLLDIRVVCTYRGNVVNRLVLFQ